MEPRRMPLPAAWLALPHVGTGRDQGSGMAARTDPQIGCLLRRGEPAQRQIRAGDVRCVQRRNFRSLPQEATAAPCARRKYRAVLSLLFLPPYSPQLAPIERVWKLARRLATHNRYFATLAEVLDAVSACFDRWRMPNSVLRRLCCII